MNGHLDDGGLDGARVQVPVHDEARVVQRVVGWHDVNGDLNVGENWKLAVNGRLEALGAGGNSANAASFAAGASFFWCVLLVSTLGAVR